MIKRKADRGFLLYIAHIDEPNKQLCQVKEDVLGDPEQALAIMKQVVDVMIQTPSADPYSIRDRFLLERGVEVKRGRAKADTSTQAPRASPSQGDDATPPLESSSSASALESCKKRPATAAALGEPAPSTPLLHTTQATAAHKIQRRGVATQRRAMAPDGGRDIDPEAMMKWTIPLDETLL